MIDYQTLTFDYARCSEQTPDAQASVRPVVVVGAGPVGLATAIDLARQGVQVVLVDDDCTLSTGSRAIPASSRAARAMPASRGSRRRSTRPSV